MSEKSKRNSKNLNQYHLICFSSHEQTAGKTFCSPNEYNIF